MGFLTVIRHAQASFGTDDYDRLSELGHAQAQALGAALAKQGVNPPDAVMIGAQRRHRETLEGVITGMGCETLAPIVHEGLNEFDFGGLLKAHVPEPPEGMNTDRAAHFRQLRETVLAWQRDEVADPPETFTAFCARVSEATEAMQALSCDHVLAVSSGGAISQMIRATLDAPAPVQIQLQLQMKNCAVNRFVATRSRLLLHGYNETPHIDGQNPDMLTYS